jgi:predicted AlkP superfamily pyrophosphatase or phosphodiesterase
MGGKLRTTGFFVLAVIVAVSQAPLAHGQNDFNKKTQHVLLISLDGFHEFELENYIASHPNSALADLASRAVRYSNAITTRPSDSFPASLAMVTGGSPASTGVFYDVSGSFATGNPHRDSNSSHMIPGTLRMTASGSWWPAGYNARHLRWRSIWLGQ